MNGEAVIVSFKPEFVDFNEFENFEIRLETALHGGEYGGNAFAMDMTEGEMFFYGDSANEIYNSIQSVLTSCNLLSNINVVLRYGPADPDTPEQSISL